MWENKVGKICRQYELHSKTVSKPEKKQQQQASTNKNETKLPLKTEEIFA